MISSIIFIFSITQLFYAGLLAEDDRYPSPLLFSRFNGNIKDITGKNQDPSVGGSISYVSGPYGDANGGLRLNNAYLEWQNGVGSPLRFQNDYTIMFWIKNQGTPVGAVFAYDSPAANRFGFEIWEYSTENSLFVRNRYENDADHIYTISNAYTTNEWVHVAISYERSTGYNRLYKDGTELWRTTQTHGVNLATDRDVVRMGQRRSNDNSFNGAMACLQVYGVYMDYRTISKALSLCRPEYTSLNPWPEPLGLWPFNKRFETKDMKRGITNNNAEIFGSLWNIGPDGSHTGSYELRGSATSYIEILNSDKAVGPLNSYTYAIWFYPTTDTPNSALINYEYGTERGGTQNWALHVWAINGGLYMCNSYRCEARGTIKSYRWNLLVTSFDFSSETARWLVNGEEITYPFSNSGNNQLRTQLANGMRIGRTFYDLDQRYMDGRIACSHMYDMPMSFQEMRKLGSKCKELEEELDGLPSGLTVMFPFNKQSRCSSVLPVGQRQELTNAECKQSIRGPRKRAGESIMLSASGITGDYAQLRPTTNNPSRLSALSDDSSFTLMFYIKLDLDNQMLTKIGFLKADYSRSDTWMGLNTNGELTLKAGGLITSDDAVLSISGAYNRAEVDWVHLAISCNRLSARCYIYRNGSYIGESVEDSTKNWFVSNSLFIELSTPDQDATTEISCLQLYNKDLSQGEILSSRDRCMQKGDRTRPPLPVGFWPLDKVYKYREITGRSRDIDIIGDIVFADDSPFSSTQGSMFRNGGSSKASIPANPGTDTRHSMSLQMYIRANKQLGFPYFAYESPWLTTPHHKSLRLFIVTSPTAVKVLTRLIGMNGNEELQVHALLKEFALNTWVRIALTYDYSTSTLKTYIDGELSEESRVKKGLELYTTTPVKIGYMENEGGHRDGVFYMTCVQLYNSALTPVQLDKAASYCHHMDTGSSHFHRPPEVEVSHTHSNANSTNATTRNRLACLQRCANNPDCLALNYFESSNLCQMTNMIHSDAGAAVFQNTGGVYLERVHPLVAEGL